MKNRTFSARLTDHLNRIRGYRVVQLNILDTHLTPVRDEVEAHSCPFVATIACIEALYRKFDKELTEEWNELYYFDINECEDLLYKELRTLENAAELAKGLGAGGRVEDVLLYAMDRGLLATTRLVKPRDMNHVAHFDRDAPRYRISGFKSLKSAEVLDCLQEFPVIASLRVSENFEIFKKALYAPTNEEICINFTTHAVLVVGSATVRKENNMNPYLIIQSFRGKKTLGFEGYVLMPFDQNFICFWLPLIYPQMEHLTYGKVEMQREPLKVYSRRKRSA